MPQVQFRRLAALATGTLLLVSCGDAATDDPYADYEVGPWPDAGGFDLGDLGTDAVEPDACDEVASAMLVRHRSVPGGRQLHLLLEDADGNPLDGAYASCLGIEAAGLGPLPVAWTRAEADPGQTLLVLAADSRDQTSEIARALIALRPEDERIAIWRWADQLTQVVGATTSRRRLLSRLDAAFASTSATPLAAAEMAAVALDEWGKFEWGAARAARTVVIIDPDGAALAVDSAEPRSRLLWVTDAAGDALRHVATRATAAETAAAIGQHLDAVDDAGLALLGFCDPGTDLELSLTVGDRVISSFGLGDAAVEHILAECTPPDALAAGPAPTPVVEFTFSDDERAIYDQFHAANNESDFFGSFRLAPETVSAPMEAKFRGQSSGACVRKNFGVNLDGSDLRHVIAGTGADEFDLISMCLDEYYVNQTNADALLAEFGLWRLAFDLIELRIDGVSQGIYLYIEDAAEEVEREVSRARALIRRRTDIDNKPAETKWSFDDDDAAALNRYNAWVSTVESLEQTALIEHLEATLDLDQYLEWIALMSLLQNGDYIDEVFFIAEETTAADGSVADFYTIQTWDPDDIFSDCHHGGRFAIVDDNGLLYCAEARIDHAIFAEPLIYARYVDVLEAMLAELDVERFSARAQATRDELVTFLEDNEVRAAMIELVHLSPGATTFELAAEAITEATDRLVADFTARHALLSANVTAWREGNP